MGFESDKIVFDSPAKTVSELRLALNAGVRVNLDNSQELLRVVELINSRAVSVREGQIIGLRINPQVGTGSIAALSTGGLISKFGFPLSEVREDLVAAFRDHPWLNGLHLHVGSQGVGLELVVEGIRRVWELVKEVEAACGAPRVQVLDIGGGLPVDYESDGPAPVSQFERQAQLLRAQVPGLFEPNAPQLMTENGRSLVAKTTFAASRVEYIKASGGRRIAVCHLGADLLLRTCYLPDTWPCRVFVCGPQGASKEEDQPYVEAWETWDIAGPLCFQGDRIAVERQLPGICAGDFIMVPDVGAYTLSMYSRYNSRSSPPVYAFDVAPDDCVHLELWRAGETVDDVLQFFNKV